MTDKLYWQDLLGGIHVGVEAGVGMQLTYFDLVRLRGVIEDYREGITRIAQLEQERDAFRADAERLAKYQYDYSFGRFDLPDITQVKFVFICRHCHNYSEAKETISHAPDCVFELHKKLMEGENGN